MFHKVQNQIETISGAETNDEDDVDGDNSATRSDSSAGDGDADVSNSSGVDSADDMWNREPEQETCETTSNGDCKEILLCNMVAPAAARRVRSLDDKHVESLKTELAKHQNQYLLMIGLLVDGTVEGLMTAGGAKVETIGGNHTRAAMQQLNNEGLFPTATVKVRLFTSLTDVHALELGIHHNSLSNFSKRMEFMDIVRVIRRRIINVDGATKRKQKSDLAQIFGYKSVTKMNSNMKTHLAVANLPGSIYNRLIRVEAAWEKGAIRNSPKSVIRQTHVSGLFIGNEKEKAEALDILVMSGYKEYKMYLIGLKQSMTRNDEKSTTEITSTSESDSEEVRKWQRLLSQKDAQIATLEAENKLLRDQLTKQETSSVPRANKRKADSKVLFNNGETVRALWKDANPKLTGWFPATVKCSNGKTVTVKFDDGMEAELAEKNVQKE